MYMIKISHLGCLALFTTDKYSLYLTHKIGQPPSSRRDPMFGSRGTFSDTGPLCVPQNPAISLFHELRPVGRGMFFRSCFEATFSVNHAFVHCVSRQT